MTTVVAHNCCLPSRPQCAVSLTRKRSATHYSQKFCCIWFRAPICVRSGPPVASAVRWPRTSRAPTSLSSSTARRRSSPGPSSCWRSPPASPRSPPVHAAESQPPPPKHFRFRVSPACCPEAARRATLKASREGSCPHSLRQQLH